MLNVDTYVIRIAQYVPAIFSLQARVRVGVRATPGTLLINPYAINGAICRHKGERKTGEFQSVTVHTAGLRTVYATIAAREVQVRQCWRGSYPKNHSVSTSVYFIQGVGLLKPNITPETPYPVKVLFGTKAHRLKYPFASTRQHSTCSRVRYCYRAAKVLL